MKKPDTFFILIVVICTILTGIYFYSFQTLNYFETNADLNARFERKKNLVRLAKKLKELENINHEDRIKSIRSIASISENTPGNTKEKEVKFSSIAETDEIAKNYYLQAKISCYEPGKEISCLNEIEMNVMHFPESTWTAESLVLLAELYFRTKRVKYVRDILKILKQDFKEVSAVQEKVAVIERHLL